MYILAWLYCKKNGLVKSIKLITSSYLFFCNANCLIRFPYPFKYIPFTCYHKLISKVKVGMSFSSKPGALRIIIANALMVGMFDNQQVIRIVRIGRHKWSPSQGRGKRRLYTSPSRGQFITMINSRPVTFNNYEENGGCIQIFTTTTPIPIPGFKV
jgi:hypothetical protein